MFLPSEDGLTKIGFKIKVENEIITVIEEQNLENVKIYRDDFIFINAEKDNEKNEISYHIESISDIDLGSDEDE